MFRKIYALSLISFFLLSTSVFAMKRSHEDQNDKISFSILDFHDDILFNIFSFINNDSQYNEGLNNRILNRHDVRLVCKRWEKFIMDSDDFAPMIVCRGWNFNEIKNLPKKNPLKYLTILYGESTNSLREVYEKFILHINQSNKYTAAQKNKFNNCFTRCKCTFDPDYVCCDLDGVYDNYKNFVTRIIVLRKTRVNTYQEIYERIMDDLITLDLDIYSDKSDYEKNLNNWHAIEAERTNEILNDPLVIASFFPDPAHRPQTLKIDDLFKYFGKPSLIKLNEDLLKYRDSLVELNIELKEDEDYRVIPQNIFSSFSNEPSKILDKLKKLSLYLPSGNLAINKSINNDVVTIISCMPQVTELDFRSTPLNNDIIKIINDAILSKQLPYLKMLNLVGTNVLSNDVFSLLNYLQKISINEDCLIIARDPEMVIDISGLAYEKMTEKINQAKSEFMPPDRRQKWAMKERARTKKLIININNGSDLYGYFLATANQDISLARKNLVYCLMIIKLKASFLIPDYSLEFYVDTERIWPELQYFINGQIEKALALGQQTAKVDLEHWPINHAANGLQSHKALWKNSYNFDIEYVNIDDKLIKDDPNRNF